MSEKVIIHVDMDAFYAAVEVRDNPQLAGKPVIVGALPHERGVVSTCSYEARKYGLRSAMSIKEAYRLCPNGIYMRPNFGKYKEASHQIHEIWDNYTDVIEYISLDEGYLDVTNSAGLFGGANAIALEIKRKTRTLGLTCSVGIGFSMMSAKLASEEKKPDGLYEIPNAAALRKLICDRGVRTIYGVGQKTAEVLKSAGIHTVRDIGENEQTVVRLLGEHGKQIVLLARGMDDRAVTPYADPKSVGKEHTFQSDVTDFNYLKDILLLIAKELSFDIRLKGLYCYTVTLKITYGDMRKITRSKSGDATNKAKDIYETAASMLAHIDRRAVRLAGISLSGLTKTVDRQLSFMDSEADGREEKLDDTLLALQRKYGADIIRTGSELKAQNSQKL